MDHVCLNSLIFFFGLGLHNDIKGINKMWWTTVASHGSCMPQFFALFFLGLSLSSSFPWAYQHRWFGFGQPSGWLSWNQHSVVLLYASRSVFRPLLQRPIKGSLSVKSLRLTSPQVAENKGSEEISKREVLELIYFSVIKTDTFISEITYVFITLTGTFAWFLTKVSNLKSNLARSFKLCL